MSGKKEDCIVKPGYHVAAKYDLPGLRKHLHAEGGRSILMDLPLTSMIDMFVILAIFLLMNFSATGEVFFIQRNLTLPTAKHTHPLENAPLITITRNKVILEAQQVGTNPTKIEESNMNLPRLGNALKQLRILEQTIRPNQKFAGQINIQADENLPLIYIKRVMQACILEGWLGINFAVRAPEGATVISDESET